MLYLSIIYIYVYYSYYSFLFTVFFYIYIYYICATYTVLSSDLSLPPVRLRGSRLPETT